MSLTESEKIDLKYYRDQLEQLCKKYNFAKEEEIIKDPLDGSVKTYVLRLVDKNVASGTQTGKGFRDRVKHLWKPRKSRILVEIKSAWWRGEVGTAKKFHDATSKWYQSREGQRRRSEALQQLKDSQAK